jgi:hypothetical protein
MYIYLYAEIFKCAACLDVIEKKYSTAKLAMKYGVSQSIVSDIINNKRWKHVK